MGIKIELPAPEGGGPAVADTVKVYDSEGHQIRGICRLDITFLPNSIVRATLEMDVTELCGEGFSNVKYYPADI